MPDEVSSRNNRMERVLMRTRLTKAGWHVDARRGQIEVWRKGHTNLIVMIGYRTTIADIARVLEGDN